MIGPWDLGVLCGLLLTISLYGLVKAHMSRKKPPEEILIGSHFSVFSVALSVCSAFISSISLIGFPSEIYYQGTMILWYGVMYFIGFPLVAFVFLPVLHNLRLTSLYSYLEMRFNLPTRCVAAFLFCLQILLYNGVALYAPSLAIATIVDIPVSVSIAATAILSAVYISLGGAQAGIHTQAIQMLLIMAAMLITIGASLMEQSIEQVIKVSNHGHRIIFSDVRLNTTVRHSVAALLIGGTGNILSLFAANQLTMQKYIAMPSLRDAQKVVLLNIPCNLLILSTYGIIGLFIYAHYAGCHPDVGSPDQLFPRFILDKFSSTRGFVGMFLAAVYSAGISTLSSSFSALSAVILEDVDTPIRRNLGKPSLSDSSKQSALRIIPVALAVFSIVIALCCKLLGTMVLQVAFTVFGAVGGPVLGAFFIGLYLPNISGRAACMGLIFSTITTFFVAFGALFVQVQPIRLSLDSTCSADFLNTTVPISGLEGLVKPYPVDTAFQNLFRISYQYYSIIGLLTNVMFSMFAQRLLGDKCHYPQELLSPLVRSKFSIPEEEPLKTYT